MLDQDAINSVNFDAIHRIISGQGAGNEAEPFYKRKKQPTEEVMKSLDSEDDLSLATCFPSLPARREREGRKPFKIDMSSIGSTLDYTVNEDSSTIKNAEHKDYNGLLDIDVFSGGANHQRTLLQKISEQNSSNLPEREKTLNNLPIQGSDRKTRGNASNANLVPNDRSALSWDGKKLEEEELTVDISTSYLDHVMESVTQMMKSEIKFDVLECEHLQTSKGVLPKVLMLEESEHHITLGNQVLQSEKGLQLDSREQTFDVMPSDVPESLQLKHAETDMILSDYYTFTNAIKGKGVGTLWTGGVRRSTRIQSRPLPNSTRQNKKNSIVSANQPLKSNESSLSRHKKGRMKEKLNWQDWQYLKGAGTSWTSGLRRSTRVRSRPLEFWRGERFLHGRIYSCLSTVIGIKYTSPKPSMLRKDSHGTFKVQSFVSKKHSAIVKFAALY